MKIQTKSGLTFIIALYSAEVQRTFMLTYALFIVVIQCSFPQLVDGLGIEVRKWSLLQVLLNLLDLNLQVAQRLFKNISVKSDARYTFQQIADMVEIRKASTLCFW